MDYSPPGSSVHGILQAIILEWVAIPSSRGSSQPRDQTEISHIAGGFFTSWATREAGSCGRMYSNTVLHCPSDQGLLTTPELLLGLRALPTPLSTAVISFFLVALQTQPSSTSTPLLRKNVHLSVSGVLGYTCMGFKFFTTRMQDPT